MAKPKNTKPALNAIPAEINQNAISSNEISTTAPETQAQIGEKDMSKAEVTAENTATLDNNASLASQIASMISTPTDAEKAQAEADRIAEMFAILESSASVQASPVTPPAKTTKATAETTAKHAVAVIDDEDRNDLYKVMCFLVLGKIVAPKDLAKFIRQGITSKAFPCGDKAKLGIAYKAIAKAMEFSYRKAGVNAEVAITTKYEDRIAVNAGNIAGFVDASQIIFDQWKYASNAEFPDAYAHPEVSLAVRAWMQFLSLQLGNPKKGVNIGESNTFKHVSATPRNFIAWLNHTEVIGGKVFFSFYDEKTSVTKIIADYIEHKASFNIVDGKKILTPQSLYQINEIKMIKSRNYRYIMQFEDHGNFMFIDDTCLDTCFDLLFDGEYNPFREFDPATPDEPAK